MDDYALVLNAGSSSLKFCVYRRPETESWSLEARGQIEGIGTSPQLKAKNAEGERIADQKLDAAVSDGRKALELFGGVAAIQIRRRAGLGCWPSGRSWRSDRSRPGDSHRSKCWTISEN